MKKYSLEIVVFVTGAVVMILELVGSRIIAPYAGTSIITWTSLIGVILGSLSYGYLLGGRLADKNPSFKLLGNTLLLSAILVASINFTKPFQAILVSLFSDLRLLSVVATTILFAPASVVLGMVPTIAARLKIDNLKSSGQTVGGLYALSTLGSIVGTFLAGFWLIAAFGSATIIIFLSIVLAVTAFLVFIPGKRGLFVSATLLVLFGLSAQNSNFPGVAVLAQTDSNYNHITIVSHQEGGRSIISLVLGRVYGLVSFQSSIFADDPGELVADYTQFFRLSEVLRPDAKSVLMLGGGGFTYARDYLARNGDARVDVVEIDPALAQVAKDYFGLEDDPRLTIYSQDARVFVNADHREKYAVIFVDAFSGDAGVPFQLTTLEAVRRMYMLLDQEGCVLMNTISSIDGDTGTFLRAEYATYKQVFGYVDVFPLASANPTEVQNIEIVACKSDVVAGLSGSLTGDYKQYYSHRWQADIVTDEVVLTDDFAPTDQYFNAILTKLN